MKVMHFHFGKDGGAERFFVHLVNALARRNVVQKVIIRPDRIWRKEIEHSAEITESHFRNASLGRILLPLHVKRTARRWKPDALFAWMPRASRLMPRHAGCIRIARLGDYPVRLNYFKNIDVLVCNTPGIGEHVKAMGWPRRIEVISNFTRTEQVVPVDRKVLDTPDDVRLISSMGRFVPRKGFDVLIRAVAQMDDTFLWIIGDGEQSKNLHALARQLGVENRVRFAGWQADPRPFVAASDVFAMASSHEPLGNVLLEAWAQRVPVVSTRCEGPMWFVRHEENALFVDIGDHEGFAQAITRVLDSPGLAGTMVAGGSKTLADKFSEEAVANAYMELFASHTEPVPACPYRKVKPGWPAEPRRAAG
ncbi:MAG: glycosyltransferase [Planctomycetaceae bacterium]|nr:glycosyltransferase [Planctomycetaceae bacterium]